MTHHYTTMMVLCLSTTPMTEWLLLIVILTTPNTPQPANILVGMLTLAACEREARARRVNSGVRTLCFQVNTQHSRR
jgi:hypothetical protein